MAVQPGLCQTWLETPETGFSHDAARCMFDLQVMDFVINGGRPEVPHYHKLMPLYSELMEKCWKNKPEERPNFKEVCVFYAPNFEEVEEAYWFGPVCPSVTLALQEPLDRILKFGMWVEYEN